MESRESELTAESVRRQLYEVMRRDVDVTRKAASALELGRVYLGVNNGHLTRIAPSTTYWEAVESTDSPDGSYPAGLSLDLGQTYCRRVIQEDTQIALHDASVQGWSDDVAYETHGLDCYLGTPVEVSNTVYGTVCFVSESSRASKFSKEEKRVAELIARLLGQELERERYESELAERKSMIDVLTRVLRHNLRNDMNVVRGNAETIKAQSGDAPNDQLETIIRRVDGLLELSEAAHELNELITDSHENRPLEIGRVLEQIFTAVRAEYPETTIALEGDTDVKILGSEMLVNAFKELVENAAQHSGNRPTVTVSVQNLRDNLRVQVSDDGSGLDAQEVAVLERGFESPLQHSSGLGLWLVYWVVKRHDGRIKASTSDIGTTVTATLPYGPKNYLAAEAGGDRL